MNPSRSGIIAGIVFSETSLRYAVVDHGSGRSLNKLGSCEFEFNLLDGLKSGLTDENRETVVAAISDTLAAAGASELVVGVHPSLARTYYTLVDNSLSADSQGEQFRREGELLFSSDKSFHSWSETLHHVIDESSSSRQMDWHMVTLLSAAVRGQVEEIVKKALNQPTISFLSALEAARRVVRKFDATHTRGNSFGLLAGQFGDLTEMAILYEGAIVHGHTIAAGSADDFFYWLVVLATRLDISPSLISNLYVFGDNVDHSQFERAVRTLHMEITGVNPLEHARLRVTGVHPDFEAPGFAACIGAAL